MSLRAIVAQLGGELHAGGLRANIPAPGHGPHDRGVSLLLDRGRLIVHAFNGADWREVLGDLRRRGLIDAAGAPSGQGGALDRCWIPAPNAPRRCQIARSLWEEAAAVAGTLGERHARRRHIDRELGKALRFHPAAPVSVYRPGGATRPALVAAIRTTDVELTYLTPGGARALDLRLSRKTVGVVPPGSAVQLDPPGCRMVVGEGVFTVLSASARFGRPGWTLLSVGNLAVWTPPSGVEDVLIAADRGRAGETAARRLARRLAGLGLEVRIAAPRPPAGEWNEAAALAALRRGGRGEGRGRAGR